MSHHLLFLLLLSTVLANEEATMLKLASSISPLPSTWTNTSSEGHCNWNGVQCHSGRVTSINLAEQNLTGTLPEEMVNLTELQTLSLHHNRFYGDLPLFVRLPNLETLHLDNNNFTSIPSDFFQGFTSLQYISLDFNNFSPWELPVDLAKCNKLESLTASGSNIAGSIPDIFDSIAQLQYLRLSFNKLSGPLPLSMANSGIQYLLLNNQGIEAGFTGGIDVLASMTQLAQVWLHGNQLTGPIPDLSNCSGIFDLQLQDNRLTGIVPTSLVTLPSLINVSLSDNKLQGLIPVFPSTVTNVANDGINNYCQVPGFLVISR